MQQQAQTARLLELVPPELRFKESPVPPSENAFPLLLEAVSTFVDLPDDKENKELETAFFDSYDADTPLPEGPLLERLQMWMARNDAALALVTKAVDRGRLSIPEIDPTPEKLNDLRKLAHIFLLRCRLAAAKGNFTAAVAELRTPLRLWRLVRGGGGSLVSYMVGTRLEAVALSEARQLAHEPRASSEALARLLGMIQPSATGPDLARSFRCELNLWIHNLGKIPAHATVDESVRALTETFPEGGYRDGLKAGIARILEGHPSPLEADETARLAVDLIKVLVEAAGKPWTEQQPALPATDAILDAWPAGLQPNPFGILQDFGQSAREPPSEAELVEAREALAGVQNPVGRLLAARFLRIEPLMDSGTPRLQGVELEADLEATRIIIALRIFALRRRELAPSLDALVDEKLLAQVPTDPFSGKPLLWIRDFSLLVSAGPDGDETGNSPYDADGRWKRHCWRTPRIALEVASPDWRRILGVVPTDLGIERRRSTSNAYPVILAAARKGVALHLGESTEDGFENEAENTAVDDILDEREKLLSADSIATLRGHLEKNRDALFTFLSSIDQGVFSLPGLHETGDRVATDEENSLCLNLRSLAELQASRALLLLHDGDFHAAVGEVVSLLKVGRIVAGGDVAFVHHVIGQGVQCTAALAARRLASRPGVCEDALEELIEAFAPPWRARDAAANMLRFELACAIEPLEKHIDARDSKTLAMILLGPESSTEPSLLAMRQALEHVLADHFRPLDSLETVELLVAKARRQIENTLIEWPARVRGRDPRLEGISRVWPEELRLGFWTVITEALNQALSKDNSESTPVPEDLVQRTREALREVSNPVGKQIAASWPWSDPEDDHALRNALRLEVDLEATRAILALRLHIERFGEAAPTLETLVERNLLGSVPRDPFSGKPLGYSLERGRLWSVGPDGDGAGAGPLFGEYSGRLTSYVWPAPRS